MSLKCIKILIVLFVFTVIISKDKNIIILENNLFPRYQLILYHSEIVEIPVACCCGLLSLYCGMTSSWVAEIVSNSSKVVERLASGLHSGCIVTVLSVR